MDDCKDYIKEVFSEVKDESDFKNATLHSLEFLAKKIDEQEKILSKD